MKILKIFGIVVGIHVFALILIFANPGCSSTTKPTPALADTTSKTETANPLDLAETEKRLITQALNSTGGNITAAATQLGISRRTLHRKLNELNAQGRNVREQARAAKKRAR